MRRLFINSAGAGGNLFERGLATEEGELTRYGTTLKMYQLRQQLEDSCKRNGYQSRTDPATMVPVYICKDGSIPITFQVREA